VAVKVKARFEGGVLRPLEEVDLREGEEVELIIRRSARRVLDKYAGILGEASAEELDRLAEEAQA